MEDENVTLEELIQTTLNRISDAHDASLFEEAEILSRVLATLENVHQTRAYTASIRKG